MPWPRKSCQLRKGAHNWRRPRRWTRRHPPLRGPDEQRVVRTLPTRSSTLPSRRVNSP